MQPTQTQPQPDAPKDVIPSQPIIETASATTSPDNAHSGSTAYIIAAVVVGILLLITMSISSCVSNFAQIPFPQTLTNDPQFHDDFMHDFDLNDDYDNNYDYTDDDDFEEFLNLFNQYQQEKQQQNVPQSHSYPQHR